MKIKRRKQAVERIVEENHESCCAETKQCSMLQGRLEGKSIEIDMVKDDLTSHFNKQLDDEEQDFRQRKKQHPNLK